MKDDEPQALSSPTSGMPETAVDRWVQPFVRFFQIESASGFVLLACTAVALLLANSPWSVSFAEIWQIRLRFAVGSFELNKPPGKILSPVDWRFLAVSSVREPAELRR